MPIVSSTIASLLDGVSQQPPQNRLPGQGEIQTNWYPSLVTGLTKRPPLRHLAKLSTGTSGSAFIHGINRDSSERYIVVLLDGDLKVYDLAGTEKTVSFPDGKGYLDVTNPKTDFAATTIGDFTFIVNKTKTVTMDDDDRSDAYNFDTLLFFDQGDWPDDVGLKVYRNGTQIASGTSDPGDGYDETGASFAKEVEGTITNTTVLSSVNTYADLPGPTGNTNGDLRKVLNKVAVYRWKEIFPTGSETWEGEADLGYSSTEGDLPDPKYVYNNYTPDTSGVYKWQVGYGRYFDVETGTQHQTPRIYKWVGDTTAGEWVLDTTSTISEVSTETLWYWYGSEYVITFGEESAGAKVEYSSPIKVIQGQTDSINDLPLIAPVSYKARVGNIEEGSEYYVQFDAPWNADEFMVKGQWVESIGFDVRKSYTLSTMPHVLIREADGTFTFRQGDWSQRRVGDENSNPAPAFVGDTINDVFFYKNRLGFLSGTSVSMSQSGVFFNFWRTTVTDLLDEDPIGVTAATSKVSDLQSAIPFRDKLLIFSEDVQYGLGGGELLTPRTVTIEVISQYEVVGGVKPVFTGDQVYFLAEGASYSSLWEMVIDPNTLEESSRDVSKHIPMYLPDNMHRLDGDPQNSVLAMLSLDATTTLWMHKFYYQQGQKLQAAFFKYTFEAATIIGFVHIDARLYLVIQYSDALYLCSISVAEASTEDQDSGQTWQPCLDRLIDEGDCVSVVYDGGTDKTTYTLPYTMTGTSDYVIVSRVGADPEAAEYPVVSSTSTTLVVDGDTSAIPVYIGQKYTATYRFTPPYVKQQKRDGSQAPVNGGRLQVRTWTVFYEDSGGFQLDVGYFNRELQTVIRSNSTQVETMTDPGDPLYLLAGVPIASGTTTVAVMAKNTEFTLDLVSDGYLPVQITSAEWTGFYHNRARSL